MDPNEQSTLPVKLPFYARLALVLLSIALIVLFMREVRQIIIPLFFSMLIAMMLLPITKWLERRGLPNGLAAFLSILLFICFVGGVVFFLEQQFEDFAKDLPTLQAHVMQWVAQLQDWISTKYGITAVRQGEYLNKMANGMIAFLTVVAQAAVLGTVGFIIWTIFVFVFTFFILSHRGLLRRFATSLFQHRHKSRVTEVLADTRLLANSYVLGLLIEMVVVAILNCLAFWIFGIKYALLLGVLGAVLNIIPYLGIYTAAAFGALITLANSTPGHALTLIIILVVVHFIDANILLPRIVGGRVKMNPLITIVVVLLGNLVWGIPGMFLFIPLAGILKLIFERVEGLKPWAILMGTADK